MTQDAFSGSVPEFYDRYLVPALFDRYAADLVARIARRDGRVLEIACGTGAVTRRLRAALPGATIVATDISPAMLAHAARAVDGVTWQTADAQALPFGDAAFDAVVCQFGVMFLPDKVRGFQEARRVLAPGGQLLVNVWDSLAANPYAAEMAAVLARLFPADPPKFIAMVHGYCDRARIAADLAAAGWDDVAIEPVALRGGSTSPEGLATGFACGSPVRQLLTERGTEPAAFVAELAPRLAVLAGDAPFCPELGAIVISAFRD
jgi:SAM-dependent methyltransferase